MYWSWPKAQKLSGVGKAVSGPDNSVTLELNDSTEKEEAFRYYKKALFHLIADTVLFLLFLFCTLCIVSYMNYIFLKCLIQFHKVTK